jgi:DNA-binding NarL/FixJ family response regulator
MSPSTIDIAVVYREPAERGALCDFISDQVGFRLVGDSGGGDDAIDLMRNKRIHVMILDLQSLAGNALEAMGALRAQAPGAGVLLLVRDEAAALVEGLMQRGATGYLEAHRIAGELVPAVRTIAMGRRYRPQAAS